ncbi:MAG TPA: hypothetical protein VEQ85_05020 [Lacipirellulaceae bacterium]|nr:hypothetical protein [Lacipirellulaceae bacterium]
MTPEEYDTFTRELQGRLAADARVLGLVALGSMAARDYRPDRWSDHDFFVVVAPGTQEAMRADLAWLPGRERIVLSFRETAHGHKVLYDDGHLLEFALFDLEELSLAHVNRYRVLLDRAGIEARLRQMAAASARHGHGVASDEALIGQFLANLLVGIGRYRRGEQLSAAQFVKTFALRHLLILFTRHLPAPQHALLDNLDPFRRFERVFPSLGAELNTILGQELPLAANALLALAQRELEGRLPAYPKAAAAVIKRQLDAED